MEYFKFPIIQNLVLMFTFYCTFDEQEHYNA
jgi:hypothetical protein